LGFVYRRLGTVGIAIPRLEVTVGDSPLKRQKRKPVPAPDAIGAARISMPVRR
jgi:hypothetical protein